MYLKDLNHLQNGSYIMRVSHENRVKSTKLMLVK